MANSIPQQKEHIMFAIDLYTRRHFLQAGIAARVKSGVALAGKKAIACNNCPCTNGCFWSSPPEPL